MTGFEITLSILILYIIDWIVIIKYIGEKPDSFENFMFDLLLSVFSIILILIVIILLYLAIDSLCQVNWYAYFTKKLF